MPISPYKEIKIKKLKAKANILYRQGLSTREIAPIVNKSHNWVAIAVRSYNRLQLSTSKK